MRITPVLAFLVAAALLLLAPARPAMAHPLLVSADPLPGAVLARPPVAVILGYTEDLVPSESTIAVIDRRGASVVTGSVVFPSGRGRAMEVRLRHLSRGTYLVRWTAVSAEDGHVVRGQFVFSVGRPDATRWWLGAAAGGGPNGLLSVFLRWLELLAVVSWAGAAFFSTFVIRRYDDRLPADTVRREERLLARVLGPAALIILAANAATLLLQTSSLAGGQRVLSAAVASLSASQYGRLWVARELLALLTLALLIPVPARRAVPQWLRPAFTEGGSWHSKPLLFVATGMAYLLALAASGHAGSSDVGAVAGSHLLSLAVLVDWAHLIGAALWVGGQISVLLVLIPLLRERRLDHDSFLDALDRFSPLAYLGIAASAVSGPFNAAIHLPSWSALVQTTYGRSLVVKLALIAVMVLVSAYTVVVLRPRLRRFSRQPRAAGTHRLMQRLVSWLHVNPLLGAGVLLATAVMFTYPAPARLAAAAGPRWTAAGLQGSLVHFLAIGPGHHPFILAATHGGIERFTPTGGWRSVLTSGDVWSVALDRRGRLAAAADDNGAIHLSVDGGLTWRSAKLPAGSKYAVTISPADPRLVLVGGAGGIYRSADFGRNWRQTLALPGSAGAAFAWQPGRPNTIYAGAVTGTGTGSTQVYVSRDAGITWRLYGRKLQSLTGIMSLTALPGGDLFAGTMGNAAWRVRAAGGVWSKAAQGMPPRNDHVAALLAVPGPSPSVYAGTLGFGVFRTTNGGTTWHRQSRGLSTARNDTIVLSLADDVPQRRLYAGTANGVYFLDLSSGP